MKVPFSRLTSYDEPANGMTARAKTGQPDCCREDFHALREMIKSRTGLWLPETKQTYLKLRLNRRLQATAMETFRDYYYFLKYDPSGQEEMATLIDILTVNETYFYRENVQLDDFIQVVAPEILARKRDLSPLSIWSAGCSTGEEPYTLAMLLMDQQGLHGNPNLNILGTDINRAVLQSAREGVYDDYSIRHLPPHLLLKYFQQDQNGRQTINDPVKAIVNFAHVNLMDPFVTGRIREMDCIFCRNVMIYFDDQSKKKCLNHLYRSLKKGGCLFLGCSESLGHISSLFEIKRLHQTIAYIKPDNAREL